MLKACWSLLLAVVAMPALAAEPAGVVEREFIYETAPFPECHASTIAETPQGLVASWFGGQYEKAKDVGIWVSRLQNGKWTAPVEVANGIQYTSVDGTVHRHPCWNPVLHQQPGGPLVLFF
ncbi:MAG TPA: exo-alpha-sialidase, partial [Planctomycetaceae bacterium]|nr:exo-alpha-sialidase [Planctomycetaceae bacterium]